MVIHKIITLVGLSFVAALSFYSLQLAPTNDAVLAAPAEHAPVIDLDRLARAFRP